MKDGAHTHGSGGGGLGVAVAVGAGAMLAAGAADAIIKVLPVLITGAAVIAVLWAVGWVTRAALTYRQQQTAWRQDATGAARPDYLAAQEVTALRQAVVDLHVQLAACQDARPGLERHEHLHFHGLVAEQVAAVLAARRHSGGEG